LQKLLHQKFVLFFVVMQYKKKVVGLIFFSYLVSEKLSRISRNISTFCFAKPSSLAPPENEFFIFWLVHLLLL